MLDLERLSRRMISTSATKVSGGMAARGVISIRFMV